jgi:hypothetical protein
VNEEKEARDWYDLPPDVRDEIENALRQGVFFGYEGGMPRGKLDRIGWRPGDPNALAEAIIGHVTVTDEIKLILDGHKYMIRKIDDRPIEEILAEVADEAEEQIRREKDD